MARIDAKRGVGAHSDDGRDDPRAGKQLCERAGLSRRRSLLGWNAAKELEASLLAERTAAALRIGLCGSRSVGILGSRNRPTGVVGRQTLPNLLKLGLVGRRPQAVVADLVNALGQDVLEEAADELLTRQRHRPPLVVFGVLVAKGHLAIVDTEDAAGTR